MKNLQNPIGGGNFVPIIIPPNHMKRCNNCGWFNLDSATRCEKCDEESFEAAEVYSEITESVPGTAAVQKEDFKAVEPAPVVVAEPAPAPAKSMMATVALGAGMPAMQQRKNLAATVMDASALMTDDAPDAPDTPDTPSQCPKCSYPISGYVEYCPNCGTTIRHTQVKSTVPANVIVKEVEQKPVKETLASTVMLNEPMSSEPYKSAVTVKETSLKATVRDIPAGLMRDEDLSDVYRLVPVGGIGEAPIVLKIGEAVTIAGRRYTFQK